MSRPTGIPGKLYGATAGEDRQRAALLGGDVPVAVYGLGKLGLPLAAVYADITGNTTGVDVDESVVRTVEAGDCHVEREPGLRELVADAVDRGALRATTDAAGAARAAALHVIVVPTLLTDEREPDLSVLESVTRDVGTGLDPGDLVVVESTVPPRTCTEVVVPVLEAGSGLSFGEFGVAACPERTVSGQAIADIRGTHPKVVGGVDVESTRVAALVYDEVTDNEVIPVPDAATASAVKVFEGVYRDVNIALANQLALYADATGVDVTGAIDVANTQPFCDIHDPGPGVGGHCIPVYPYFLTGAFDVEAPLLETARAVNDGMPEHTAALLRRALGKRGIALGDATVLLLGVTYKGNVAETRNAPSLAVARELRSAGATLLGADPLVEDWSAFEGVEPVALEAVSDRSRGADAAVVLAVHDEIADLDWSRLEELVVLDAHDALEFSDTHHDVVAMGRPLR